VLRPSQRVIAIDWRDALEDILADLTRAIGSHRKEASSVATVVDEVSHETGALRVEGHAIQFERTRDGIANLRQKLRAVEIATSDVLAFRVDDEGSDTIVLGLLRRSPVSEFDGWKLGRQRPRHL
jgi:hypothetical protein